MKKLVFLLLICLIIVGCSDTQQADAEKEQLSKELLQAQQNYEAVSTSPLLRQ